MRTLALIRRMRSPSMTSGDSEDLCFVNASRLQQMVLQHVDPKERCIAFEVHGSIPITADGVTEVLGLPNKGDNVFYGCDTEATKFMAKKYGFRKGTSLDITAKCKMIEDMKRNADDDFMRASIALMVTCFLCLTTGLSPRCYPIVVDLERVKKLVVDQIMRAVIDMGTKKTNPSPAVYTT